MHRAGRNEEHEDEDKLKITVFNIKQGRERQGKADTHRNTGSNE